MYEQSNPNSFWRPFFNMLPKSYNMPFSWTDKTLKLLKGTDLYGSAKQTKNWMMWAYQHMIAPIVAKYPDCFDEKQCTYALFEWTVSMIYSRQFTYVDNLACLVPLLDMGTAHRPNAYKCAARIDVCSESQERAGRHPQRLQIRCRKQLLHSCA
jgi:hypothetical protein